MNNDEKEKVRFDRADQLGQLASKTLITLNAGGLLSLLTFIGNSSAQSRLTLSVSNVQMAIYFFLISIMCIFISMSASYVFYANPPKTKIHQWFDEHIIAINISLFMVSLFYFAYGILAVANGAIIQ